MNRIKLFGIIILVFISNVLPVYGGEGDKRGVLDELAGDAKAKRFEREAIGSKGHYLCGGDFKQTDSYPNAGNITNRERYLTVEETENGMSAEEKNAQINKR